MMQSRGADYRDKMIADLRNALEDRDEEIRRLRAQARPRFTFALDLELTPAQAAILSLLYARAPASVDRERLATSYISNEADPPGFKSIEVQICKMRPMLARLGIKLATLRGYGYSMSIEDAARLRAFVQIEGPGHPLPHVPASRVAA